MTNATLAYSLLQSSEWAIDSCLYCYSGVFLLSCGLSNTLIGWILGFAVVLSFIGQVYFGDFFNRHGQKSLKKFFYIGGTILLICNVLIYIGLPNIFSIMLFIFSILYLQLFPAFMNSAAMYEIQHGVKLNYGIGRGSGSLGYAICTIIIGQLILPYGISAIFFSGACLTLLFLLGINWFFNISEKNRITDEIPSVHVITSNKKFNFRFFSKYKVYTIILIGTVFTMTGHTYMSNFIYQILSSKNGNEATVGIASAIAACCEIPVLFIFSRIQHKFRSSTWFKMSCCILTLKMLFAFSASSITLIIASEVLQAGYALFVVSSVYFTSELIPKEDTINSQAYMNAASTLGVLFSLLSGGLIIDQFGISILLFTGFLSLLVGTIIIFYATSSLNSKNKKQVFM